MAEPIQDDLETVRAVLKLGVGVEWRDARAALDRLVAERDRLIQGIGALVEKWNNERPGSRSRLDIIVDHALDLEALTKTSEEVRP